MVYISTPSEGKRKVSVSRCVPFKSSKLLSIIKSSISFSGGGRFSREPFLRGNCQAFIVEHKSQSLTAAFLQFSVRLLVDVTIKYISSR